MCRGMCGTGRSACATQFVGSAGTLAWRLFTTAEGGRAPDFCLWFYLLPLHQQRLQLRKGLISCPRRL
jgi:hypothetical protein